MLNRQLSSSKNNNTNNTPKKKKKKQQQSPPRSPLRDHNCVAKSDRVSRTSSSSSSMSVDAPRGGCLRFFISNSKIPLHGPKSLSKTTPKSAPNPNPSKNPSFSSRSHKPFKENLPKPKRNPPCLYQWQSGKKQPISKTAQKSNLYTGLDNSASGSEGFSQNQSMVKMVHETGESPELPNLPNFSTGVVENSTPVGKFECGSGLGFEFDDNNNKPVEEDLTTNPDARVTTPPVQASVSPEIQCGSSMLVVSSATPACYGAGHIVSGVTDRRKCRAKGILTVGGIDSSCGGKANIFDNGDDDIEILSKSRASMLPRPAEASMHWLSSNCDGNNGDQKNDLENGLRCLRKSLGSATLHSDSSPSSAHRISSDLRSIFENSVSTSTSSRRRTKITLLSPRANTTFQGLSPPISPHATPTCEAVISQEKRKHRYDLAAENSPFSIDSLGSENVIQTPQSDLSSDRHVDQSWLNALGHQKHDFGSEIDSEDEVLLRASLSPKTDLSIWDPPGLSFQFPDLASPSNSIDFTQLANAWDNRASFISDSTFEDMSRSQMSISWRDGLVSRIFEMDEFDCCICLSDDENDANGCSNAKVKSDPSHEFNVDVGNIVVFSSPEVVGHERESAGEAKEKFSPQKSNPCSESICTDGGGLISSGDSDWTMCYKNQLFRL